MSWRVCRTQRRKLLNEGMIKVDSLVIFALCSYSIPLLLFPLPLPGLPPHSPCPPFPIKVLVDLPVDVLIQFLIKLPIKVPVKRHVKVPHIKYHSQTKTEPLRFISFVQIGYAS